MASGDGKTITANHTMRLMKGMIALEEEHSGEGKIWLTRSIFSLQDFFYLYRKWKETFAAEEM